MDLLSRPVLQADHRIPYGTDPAQFGDLWLPGSAAKKAPLVVFFHGGWWKAQYDLGYAGYLCAALKKAGIATWSVEYRRVGMNGGGWPGTLQDAAAGMDFVSTLASKYLVDLDRVITMGHSAGGHLAFWCAGRHHIPIHSELHTSGQGIPLRGAIALAGAVDLRLTIDLSYSSLFAHDRDEVYRLMGGTPLQFPERYKAANPGDLLPFQAPQILIQGSEDDQIPPDLPRRWVDKSKQSGSEARTMLVPGADHFDVVDPTSSTWPVVLKAVEELLHATPP